MNVVSITVSNTGNLSSCNIYYLVQSFSPYLKNLLEQPVQSKKENISGPLLGAKNKFYIA